MKRVDKTIRIAASACLAVLVAYAAGFVYFVAQIPDHQEPSAPQADGIVVLTGAALRIADAVHLLEAGHAKRLLITGVHPATSRRALTRQMPSYRRLFECCIDIGHSAQNTVGNAAEARAWARTYGFTSLIVVTSNYHLPRSLAEFTHAMPDMRLIAYPVISESFRRDRWLVSGSALRLVVIEYFKYIASIVRRTVADPPVAVEADRRAPGGSPGRSPS